MTAAYFEDHPTDPEKVILRKPPLDQGADYERGFVDGMQYQMQSSVDKAVNAMSQRTWVDLTRTQMQDVYFKVLEEHRGGHQMVGQLAFGEALQAKLKEKNSD
jgi:hypothetical protein